MVWQAVSWLLHTGGLADALSNADDSSVLDNLIKGGLLSVNDLLGAMPYLIPSYTYTTVTYVNGGYVEGDIAGGYAGNFQSGKVNQFSETDLENDSTLADVQSRVQANPVAVVNLDHVTGGAYAGGFGGKVVSGALASAGNGGLSLLGKFGTVDLANLLQVCRAMCRSSPTRVCIPMPPPWRQLAVTRFPTRMIPLHRFRHPI